MGYFSLGEKYSGKGLGRVQTETAFFAKKMLHVFSFSKERTHDSRGLQTIHPLSPMISAPSLEKGQIEW
jgi:hypothetical protein